ncbi:MAG: DUF3333 domain-containing protein, partial [Betaproteobacteria bacterium]|nr:DUF3333 domain-containing protein [Betaproteobacteria bacterium]
MNRQENIARRYRRQRVFVASGIGATALALLFLVGLFAGVVALGWRGFMAAEMRLTIDLDVDRLGDPASRNPLVFEKLIRESLRSRFPDLATSRANRKMLDELVSFGAAVQLHEMVKADPQLAGTVGEFWLPTSSKAEAYLKGSPHAAREVERRALADAQLDVLDALVASGDARVVFNTRFFTNADSRDPELAGIAGAVAGSFFTILITFLISFPLGVGAAIFLELFASRSRFFTIVEININ